MEWQYKLCLGSQSKKVVLKERMGEREQDEISTRALDLSSDVNDLLSA